MPLKSPLYKKFFYSLMVVNVRISTTVAKKGCSPMTISNITKESILKGPLYKKFFYGLMVVNVGISTTIAKKGRLPVLIIA